jgi:hypothetical protein
MSAGRVAIIPECVECGDRWLPDDPERWQLRELDDGDLAWFCARYAEREFG